MKKTIAILLILMATVFATCAQIPAENLSKQLCDSYAADGENINAGCCYYQVGEWGKCSLYLLKGARHAEILWDLNRGSFDQGAVAKQYYNPEYYPSSGLGSETGVCLHNYGNDALTKKIEDYHNWIIYYGYGGKDKPPFDMDVTIASLESAILPPEPTATAAPTVAPTAKPTVRAPTATPLPQSENNWTVPLIILVIIAVVGYLLLTRRKPAEPKYPESMEKAVKHKGYLHHVAEKAKEEHTAKKPEHHTKAKAEHHTKKHKK